MKEVFMASKFQFISELADHIAHSVTKNAVAWKNYLDTASRLYNDICCKG